MVLQNLISYRYLSGSLLTFVLSSLIIGSPKASGASQPGKKSAYLANSDEETLSESRSSIKNDRNAWTTFRTGLIVGGVPGAGVDLAYKLNPSVQVGVNLLSGSYDAKPLITSTYSNVTIDKVDLNARIYEAYGRYFLSKSFAFTGGLSYRQIDSEIMVSSSDRKTFINTKSKGEAIAAKIGVGNYWTWDSGFTLGCEWAGYMVPVSGSYTSSTDSAGILSDDMTSIKKDSEDLGKFYAKSSLTQLLNLVVGYSF